MNAINHQLRHGRLFEQVVICRGWAISPYSFGEADVLWGETAFAIYSSLVGNDSFDRAKYLVFAMNINRELVKLRPLSYSDVDNIMEWVNNPEIVGNLAAFSGESFTREQEREYILRMKKSQSDWVSSIFTQTDEYLGQIGIHQIHERSRVGRLSVVIGNRENMGRGYGSAAIANMLDTAFAAEDTLAAHLRGRWKQPPLHKVWLMVFESNERAQRTYSRLGFQIEGVLRDEYYHEGRWHNMIRMGMLASEWENNGRSES